jgi:hypothetical protein
MEETASLGSPARELHKSLAGEKERGREGWNLDSPGARHNAHSVYLSHVIAWIGVFVNKAKGKEMIDGVHIRCIRI